MKADTVKHTAPRGNTTVLAMNIIVASKYLITIINTTLYRIFEIMKIDTAAIAETIQVRMTIPKSESHT